MSGLPGAGKDTWVAEHASDLPVVSLDQIRQELGIDPAADQAPVIDAARERARHHLRQGAPFVWNATNVSRKLRDRVIRLLADYGARVRIVYVEAPPDALKRDNQARESRVPERVMDKLLAKWSVPTVDEAHDVVLALRP